MLGTGVAGINKGGDWVWMRLTYHISTRSQPCYKRKRQGARQQIRPLALPGATGNIPHSGQGAINHGVYPPDLCWDLLLSGWVWILLPQLYWPCSFPGMEWLVTLCSTSFPSTHRVWISGLTTSSPEPGETVSACGACVRPRAQDGATQSEQKSHMHVHTFTVWPDNKGKWTQQIPKFMSIMKLR